LLYNGQKQDALQPTATTQNQNTTYKKISTPASHKDNHPYTYNPQIYNFTTYAERRYFHQAPDNFWA